MLLEWLLELKDSIDKHGVRWGVLFALYAIYRKERRNYRLDRRDDKHLAYFDAILAGQKQIMDKLGVDPCAHILNPTIEPSAPRGVGGFIFSLEERLIALYAKKSMSLNMRRKQKMNLQNLNKMWLVWLIALVGGKIAMHFGIKFPDSYANDVADFILQYVAPLVLAWLNKHKDAVKAIKITGDGPAV